MHAPIERITLHRVSVPLRGAVHAAHGDEITKEATIVEVETGENVGWGECAALAYPSYTSEYADGAFRVLCDVLAPRALLCVPAEAIGGLASGVVGHPMARAALELAVLDALLRSTATSLASHLGVRTTNVPAGVAVGLHSDPAKAVDVVGTYVAQGYRRIKVKIGARTDRNVLAAVRDAYPDLFLVADANGSYTLRDSSLLASFDELDLACLEQPLAADDLEGHAALQQMIKTPLCLDESITSVRTAERALRAGACRVVNVKASRLGGVYEARRVVDACRAHGAGAWIGGMYDLGVARAANVVLAGLDGVTIPGDISGSDRFFATDIVTNPITVVDGQVPVPTGPGLGIEVDPDALARFTIAKETLVR